MSRRAFPMRCVLDYAKRARQVKVNLACSSVDIVTGEVVEVPHAVADLLAVLRDRVGVESVTFLAHRVVHEVDVLVLELGVLV